MKWNLTDYSEPTSPPIFFCNGETLSVNIYNEYTQLQIDHFNVERKKVEDMHRKGQANEEILRKIERELDLEETRLNMDIFED